MKKFKKKRVVKQMIQLCILSYQKEHPFEQPSNELIRKWKMKLEGLTDNELTSLFTQYMLNQNVLKDFIK